ncbi:ataxin-10 isoform X3 [Manis javanica]|uniref:ataxin-10 isoform X3 n=1 Tax=Manis javanica TaxID=9974 RepID=UPI003C6CE15B
MAAPRPPPARLSGVMVPAPIQDLEALRALTALFKEQRNRETAPRTIFQRVLDILKKSSHAVELACRDPSQVEHLASSLQLITECFRCLRNACIECSVNQNSIRNLDTIGVAVGLILLFRELRVEQEALLTAFRCGLQFVGNIASRNEESQSIVWVHAFPELFLSCLNHPDKKIVAYSSMILFTSLNSERMKELEENLNIAINVIEAHQKQPESEWPVTLLDLIIAKIVGDEPLTKDDIPVFLSHAELIASTFVDQCKIVLKLTSEQHADDEEALATIRLLDVLCEMTANTDLLSYLQVFPGLLERVIDLLRLIHVAGNDTTNVFSTCGCLKGEGDVSNMAEGFKSHLIRLIGNLCYKNKDNQDKVERIPNADDLPRDPFPVLLHTARWCPHHHFRPLSTCFSSICSVMCGHCSSCRGCSGGPGEDAVSTRAEPAVLEDGHIGFSGASSPGLTLRKPLVPEPNMPLLDPPLHA